MQLLRDLQRSKFLNLLLQGRFPEFGLAFLDRVILFLKNCFQTNGQKKPGNTAYFVMSTENMEAESQREKARGCWETDEGVAIITY